MEIKIKRQRGWRGGIMRVGDVYNLPNDQAKMLVDEGCADYVAAECAMADPAAERAIQKRPKPRKVKRANSRPNSGLDG